MKGHTPQHTPHNLNCKYNDTKQESKKINKNRK